MQSSTLAGARAQTRIFRNVRHIYFPRQQWFRERASLLRHTHIACIVKTCTFIVPQLPSFQLFRPTCARLGCTLMLKYNWFWSYRLRNTVEGPEPRQRIKLNTLAICKNQNNLTVNETLHVEEVTAPGRSQATDNNSRYYSHYRMPFGMLPLVAITAKSQLVHPELRPDSRPRWGLHFGATYRIPNARVNNTGDDI